MPFHDAVAVVGRHLYAAVPHIVGDGPRRRGGGVTVTAVVVVAGQISAPGLIHAVAVPVTDPDRIPAIAIVRAVAHLALCALGDWRSSGRGSSGRGSSGRDRRTQRPAFLHDGAVRVPHELGARLKRSDVPASASRGIANRDVVEVVLNVPLLPPRRNRPCAT